MKRTIRNRRVTPEEAVKYKAIWEQVTAELPDLVARHQERMATLDELQGLLLQLKAAREAKGLSLSEIQSDEKAMRMTIGSHFSLSSFPC
jgi:hypothetical protein